MADFIITYEGEDPLTIRLPDFGDNITLESTKIVKQTTQGQYIIFKDSTWLWDGFFLWNWSFTEVCESIVNDLEELLKTKAGEEVTITYGNFVNFTGIILNPGITVINARKGIYKFSIAFLSKIL